MIYDINLLQLLTGDEECLKI